MKTYDVIMLRVFFLIEVKNFKKRLRKKHLNCSNKYQQIMREMMENPKRKIKQLQLKKSIRNQKKMNQNKKKKKYNQQNNQNLTMMKFILN
jgi:hypothetical protein